MKQLLRYEFRKLFRSKAFYILLAVQVAVTLIGVVSTKAIENLLQDPNDPNYYVSAITGVSQMLTAVTGTIFSMTTAIFASIFLCEDYSSGTIKNIVSRGYSRLKVSTSKYLVSFVGVLIMGAASALITFALASALWKVGVWDINATKSLFGEMAYLLAYHAFFCFVATLCMKIGATIAINLVAPLFVDLILTLVDTLINLKDVSISNYFFTGIGSSFAANGYANENFGLYFSILLIYFALFVGAGLFISSKKEF